MIGWFLTGLVIGAEKKSLDRRKAARLEQRRARPPRPELAWALWAVVTIVMLIAGGAGVLVFMAGCAVAVAVHEKRRRLEHTAWLSENTPSLEQLKAADAKIGVKWPRHYSSEP